MKPFLLLFLLACQAQAADLTASATVEAGKAYPQSNLADFLIDGTAYRIDLFGGAKLQNIKFLNAIGLGLDFTYTNWRPKNKEAGFRYKQYQWNMFKLPIALGWFLIEPAAIWMVTDVGIPHLNIDNTSIRPGLAITAGMRIPLFAGFNLRGDVRAQRVMMEKELTNTNERINVTGQSYTWFLGGEVHF